MVRIKAGNRLTTYRTVPEIRKLIHDNLLRNTSTISVSLLICHNEPDFIGSNGTAADEVAGAEGSEANAQTGRSPAPDEWLFRPDPIRRPRLRNEASGQYGRPTSRATSTHRVVAAPLDGAVVRLPHGFAGVRWAGLEHSKALKQASVPSV